MDLIKLSLPFTCSGQLYSLCAGLLLSAAMSSENPTVPKFDGSNWEDLDRHIALARLAFLQDDKYDDNEPRRCAYLASEFTGPALDWAMGVLNNNADALDDFDIFIQNLKRAFGVELSNIVALRRKCLDDLRWSSHVPSFFAEFDRLTLQLGLTANGTRIQLVEGKLPHDVRVLLAQQALSFADYATMRERLITMWALNPTRATTGNLPGTGKSRPKCGNCGKKGHTATNCRGASKN